MSYCSIFIVLLVCCMNASDQWDFSRLQCSQRNAIAVLQGQINNVYQNNGSPRQSELEMSFAHIQITITQIELTTQITAQYWTLANYKMIARAAPSSVENYGGEGLYSIKSVYLDELRRKCAQFLPSYYYPSLFYLPRNHEKWIFPSKKMVPYYDSAIGFLQETIAEFYQETDPKSGGKDHQKSKTHLETIRSLMNQLDIHYKMTTVQSGSFDSFLKACIDAYSFDCAAIEKIKKNYLDSLVELLKNQGVVSRDDDLFPIDRHPDFLANQSRAGSDLNKPSLVSDPNDLSLIKRHPDSRGRQNNIDKKPKKLSKSSNRTLLRNQGVVSDDDKEDDCSISSDKEEYNTNFSPPFNLKKELIPHDVELENFNFINLDKSKEEEIRAMKENLEIFHLLGTLDDVEIVNKINFLFDTVIAMEELANRIFIDNENKQACQKAIGDLKYYLNLLNEYRKRYPDDTPDQFYGSNKVIPIFITTLKKDYAEFVDRQADGYLYLLEKALDEIIANELDIKKNNQEAGDLQKPISNVDYDEFDQIPTPIVNKSEINNDQSEPPARQPLWRRLIFDRYFVGTALVLFSFVVYRSLQSYWFVKNPA